MDLNGDNMCIFQNAYLNTEQIFISQSYIYGLGLGISILPGLDVCDIDSMHNVELLFENEDLIEYQYFDMSPNEQKYLLSGEGYWVELNATTHDVMKVFKVAGTEIDHLAFGVASA